MTKQHGFTLIELLVSMGIIAVLTSMAVFNFNQSRVRARDVQRKSDLGQLTKAMELFKNDNGEYPDPDDGDLQTQLTDGLYSKVTFVDPRGTECASYEYVRTDRLNYYLVACLENKADSTRTTDSDLCVTVGHDTTCECADGAGILYTITNP